MKNCTQTWADMTLNENDEDDHDNEEQEEDDNELLFLLTVVAVLQFTIMGAWCFLQEGNERQHHVITRRTRRSGGNKIGRNPTLFDERLQWELFVGKFGNRAEFKRHIRMSAPSFQKLIDFIGPSLEVDFEMARRRGGQIYPELCLYACLRFLAGGSYSDIRFFTGTTMISTKHATSSTVVF